MAPCDHDVVVGNISYRLLGSLWCSCAKDRNDLAVSAVAIAVSRLNFEVIRPSKIEPDSCIRRLVEQGCQHDIVTSGLIVADSVVEDWRATVFEACCPGESD